jgi:hypothetical protein
VAFSLEAVSALFYMFLKPGSSYALVLVMFIIGGASRPPAMRSWASSRTTLCSSGIAVGQIALPLAKRSLSWRVF